MQTRRAVLQAGLATVCLGAFDSAFGMQTQGAAWLYRTPLGNGAFLDQGKGGWVETTPAGDQWFFMETARRDGFIELRDAHRRLRLRLYPNSSSWLQEPANLWHEWVEGRWVPLDEVPPLADYRVRLAYFVPSDRTPVNNYADKIRVLMHFVDVLYDQSLRGREHPSKSLPYQMDNGVPKVHLIRSSKPASYYNGAPNIVQNSRDQWLRIYKDIPPHVGVPSTHLIMAFAETFDDGPSKFEWPGGVAQGALLSKSGGVAIFSSWILKDELCATTVRAQRERLFDATPIPGRTALGYGKPNSPRLHFVRDAMWAIPHELGHALGLPHDRRQFSHNIMGRCSREIPWNFREPPQVDKGCTFSEDSVRRLLSSRYLASDFDPNDISQPTLELRIVNIKRTEHQVSVNTEVTAADEHGLRSIIFFSKREDSTAGGRWLSGKRQVFSQELTIQSEHAEVVQLEATLIDSGGNAAFKQVSMKVP